MEKILITGGAGFLASRFAEYYKNKYEIIAVKRAELDITDERKTIELIEEIRPNYVLHTAAIADTGACEKNPQLSYKINVEGTVNVAKGCRDAGAKLIYLSSEQIYNGNMESGPYGEETKPEPNTKYGEHKLKAEAKLKELIENAWILRLTWQFGFPERNGKVNANIIWNVLSAALKGDQIKVPSNEFRGMTYVYDCISNMEKILQMPYGTYNTGSENDLSTYDVAALVVKELGLEKRIDEILIKDEERFKDHPRDLRISNAKLRRNGIEFLSTEEGIQTAIREFGYGLK